MRRMTVLALAASVTLGALGAGSANAAQGCGPGGHRGPYGHCRPNYGPGPVAVVAPGLVVGNFYAGRGYWDGHRYWHNRFRHGGGWRYR